jgi:hypothetical protein
MDRWTLEYEFYEQMLEWVFLVFVDTVRMEQGQSRHVCGQPVEPSGGSGDDWQEMKTDKILHSCIDGELRINGDARVDY